MLLVSFTLTKDSLDIYSGPDPRTNTTESPNDRVVSKSSKPVVATMVTKVTLLLMFAGACLAYPTEEEVRPPNVPGPVDLPQPLSEPPIGPGDPLPEGPSPGASYPGAPLPEAPLKTGQELPPPDGPIPEGGKPENADLKTDSSSYWWRSTYYPTYYYRPRAYTTYRSYWRPYYYWW